MIRHVRSRVFRWFAMGIVAIALPDARCARAADEIKRPTFVRAWGKKGDKPGEFHSPIQIAINARDEVFVADLNNSRVRRFTEDGRFLGAFDLPLDPPPRKSCLIGGAAIDRQGRLYLSYMLQDKIAIHDENGKMIREWGKRGTGDGEFHQPGGLVLRADGALLAADQCNHRIRMSTLEGKFLEKRGGHGSEPGRFGGPEPAGSRFARPHFLAQDGRGRVYSTEGAFGRVQQLSAEGKPLKAWGNKGDEPGGFGSYQFGSLKNSFGPIGVLADRHDRVWVGSLNDREQPFTPDGKFLLGIGDPDDPIDLSKPHGMALDSKG